MQSARENTAYALYHTLSLNFLSHQRQIIEDHSPLELTRTLMQKHNWPQDDEHLTFLPFWPSLLAWDGEQVRGQWCD